MPKCPSCGDILVVASFEEAMLHLSKCDDSSGYEVLGVKPKYADKLYRRYTRKSPPDKPRNERMEYYWGLEE